MAAKDALGKRGEDLAAAYLTDQGLWCSIAIGAVGRRARHRRDRPPRLVVCEVKTRTSTRYGLPAEAVDARKARRIRQLAGAWLAAHRVPWVEVRYDVLAVLAEPGAPVRVHHYEAAF